MGDKLPTVRQVPNLRPVEIVKYLYIYNIIFFYYLIYISRFMDQIVSSIYLFVGKFDPGYSQL